jgi:hypothetical protein
VTGGFKDQTAEWVRRRGMKYPYADDAEYSLAGPFDIYGLPHAILVAPTGEVLFSGPSDELTEDFLKSKLPGALKKAPCDLPEAVAPVRDALLKGDFTAAHQATEALKKETEGREEAAHAVKALFELRLKGAANAQRAGDLLGAGEVLERLRPHLATRADLRAEFERIEEALRKAPDAEKILAAQRRLRELTRPPATKEAAESAVKELETLGKEHAGRPLAPVVERALRFLRRLGGVR